MRRYIPIAIIAILLGGIAACSRTYAQPDGQEEATTEKTVAARELNRVKTSVKIGPIHIFADSADAVQIKAVRRVKGGTADERRRWLQETRVSIEQNGDILEIKDIIPEDLQHSHSNGHNFNMHLDVDIHLPERLSLELSSGVGDIEVDGQSGGVSVNTGVGTVQLKRLKCAGKLVDAHVGAGDIDVEGQTGALTVDAGTGHVVLKGLECSGRTVHVEDGAGDVTAALLSIPTDSLKVHVGTGNVKVNLPSGTRAKVDMSTGVGEVHSKFTLTQMRRTGGPVGGTLSGDLNGGGTALHLDAGVGEVRLE